ncbi:hypothetical protein [Gracilimonas sp.]|uniref:hypothetical protein n=1 Tax=Gracilimonas sp. TaxID=1974203 RepID=UPI0032EFF2A7
MKKVLLFLTAIGLAGFVNPLKAQLTDGHEALKKHVNSVVEEVESAETAEQKRVILNESLEDMMTAVDKINSKPSVSNSDKKNLGEFKKMLTDRRNELNGTDGFKRVSNGQLNDYANFIQQDIEQADTVLTISATTALLIVIILLLL